MSTTVVDWFTLQSLPRQAAPPDYADFMKLRISRMVGVIGAMTLAMATSAMATSPGWTTDLAAAKKQAAETQRDIFMNFTGSDW